MISSSLGGGGGGGEVCTTKAYSLYCSTPAVSTPKTKGLGADGIQSLPQKRISPCLREAPSVAVSMETTFSIPSLPSMVQDFTSRIFRCGASPLRSGHRQALETRPPSQSPPNLRRPEGPEPCGGGGLLTGGGSDNCHLRTESSSLSSVSTERKEHEMLSLERSLEIIQSNSFSVF